MTKAKPKPKKPSKAHARVPKLLFVVEVSQNGALQERRVIKVNRLVPKSISFGSGARAMLPIPLSNLPAAVDLFEIRGGKVSLLLDPRYDGFLNTGSRFGHVHEFVSPQGALADVASISEPLPVELHHGGRGCLRFHGFEILFKVIRDAKPERALKVVGAGRAIFQPARTDVGFELGAAPLAMGIAALVFIPLTMWLLKAPRVGFGGLESLPMRSVLALFDPIHLRYLPYVAGPKLDLGNPVPQAIAWVRALQGRWNGALQGAPEGNKAWPLLAEAPPDMSQDLGAWAKAAGRDDTGREGEKTSESADRFKRALRSFAVAEAPVAGGSASARQLRFQRLSALMRKAYASYREQILQEQNFLAQHYAGEKLKIKRRFEIPSTGILFTPDADPEFDFERRAYAQAENWARRALASQERMWLAKRQLQEQGRLAEDGTVWFGGPSVWTPARSGNAHAWSEKDARANRENLLHNAAYASGERALPPPPAPKASIDRRDVELVILGKREEIKSCYDAALRRNRAIAGQITWSWEINPLGRAQNVTAMDKGGVAHGELFACIQRRILTWKFPRPRNGTVVFSYPLRFVPGGRR